MRPSYRNAPLILLTLLLVLPVESVHAQGKKKRDAGPTLVKIDRVTMLPRATGQTFVGTLEPIRRSVIGSAVEERVEAVFVEEGDFVNAESDVAKKLLVELHHDTIDLAVQASQIELNLSQHVFEELSKTIPTQIDSAKAEVARLDANLEFARKVYDRARGLAASLSRQESEEAFSQFNSALQSINVAKAELQRLEATREVRMAIAQSNIDRQQSELKRNQDLQARHSVFAPFSGYVSRRLVESGNWVTRGTPLIEIVQVDPIQLRIQVPQEFSTAMQSAFDRATVESPLLAEIHVDSLTEPVSGTVFRIVPDADPRIRSVPVIIRIDNPTSLPDGAGGNLLKPGLLARANLQFGQGEKVVMVPKDALVLNQGAATIYLIDRSSGKPVVREQSVTTGNSSGNWIEVIGEVSDNAEVVVQGNERLRDGESVEILILKTSGQ